MDSALTPLVISFLVTFITGIFPFIFVKRPPRTSIQSGFLTIVLAWFLSFIFGMLPYVLWGGEFTLINAWFESVSGFTTTGASILNDIEALPRGLLFWRQSTTWIGGIGVVMFALVVLPSIGRSRQLLYNVELSTIAKDNFHYRSYDIMRILIFV